MKICKRCGEGKPLTDYYKHKGMSDGRLSFCKECTKARVRKHREENDHVREAERKKYKESPDRREGISRTARLWAEKYPDRARAHNAVNNAVRDGKLIKPETCSRCGSKGRIHGHHHDYTLPLDVVWLCARCHSAEHKQ